MPGPARNPLSRPRLIAAVAAIALLALIVALAPAGSDESSRAEAQSAGLALRQIGEFEAPLYVEDAPGARKLLFVVEQAGTIRVMRRGKALARPFLNISDLVASGGERGLFSVAFAPDYRKTRRFYVYFTNLSGAIEVDEFRRRRKSDVVAQEASRRPLLEIDHSAFANHNGGQLQFGPDGYLYLATGDGGGAGDPLDNARNLDSLLGKLLRIDPTTKGGALYSVPPDNPYVGRDGADEIYSYRLRNPYRFSFDSATGDLALADVGQSAWEEVNYLSRAAARGANFGWPALEGNQPFAPNRPGADPPVPPVFAYPNSDETGNCAITGGYVVRGKGPAPLLGRYVYADLCVGDLRSISIPGGGDDRSLGLKVATPTSFGEGRGGRIYVTSLDGPVYELVAG